jgi:hypothetical protein
VFAKLLRSIVQEGDEMIGGGSLGFLLQGWSFRVWLATGMAMAVFWAPLGMADQFLDTIRGEVHAVEVDSASQKSLSGRTIVSKPAAKTRKSAPKRVVEHDMPLNLSASELGAHLKNNYLGSYSFYKRLNDEQKQLVYQIYRKQPRIALLREKIKQLYLAR